MNEISKKTNSDQNMFDNEKKEILDCQQNKMLNSCFKCKNLIDCETRKRYVKAVYNSMSHGSSGGFEF